ncbi:hypothetical protein [Haloarcula sp. K1]|uniref:hypothetical protein n=1 Tax=Haloarcula sp. K1 TaxID=1622207 RepID=UPI0012BAEEE7|nr:hypothetical protein [Haloarcula sp. K1]
MSKSFTATNNSEAVLSQAANSVLEMPLPDDRLTDSTRTAVYEELSQHLPDAKPMDQGYGRAVIWVPELPHRQLTPQEAEQTYDGLVLKFAYNDFDDGGGIRQNKTEISIWERGTPIISREHLTPVFESGTESLWLAMPYRDMVRRSWWFEDQIIKVFGEIPRGDIGTKHFWGIEPTGGMECYDYGRCPTSPTD